MRIAEIAPVAAREECMPPRHGLPRLALYAVSSVLDFSVTALGDSRDSALNATMRSNFEYSNESGE